MRAVLDFKNAAHYLDMTSDALRDLVKYHRIPYKKRGDRLIFLIRDLDAWLRALPGPNAEEVLEGHRFPDTLTDTTHSHMPHQAPSDTTAQPPIAISRGRQRRIGQAQSGGER